MNEKFNLYNNESQKERIETTIANLERKNIKWLNLDSDELSSYFLVQDINIVKFIQMNFLINKYEVKRSKKEKFFKNITKQNIKNDKTQNKEYKIIWEEITPYTILEIEDKEYTKEELLEIVGKKINLLCNDNIDYKKEKTNEILDAYNELAKKIIKRK